MRSYWQVANDVDLPDSLFANMVADGFGPRANPISMTAYFPAVGASGPITGTLFNLPKAASFYNVRCSASTVALTVSHGCVCADRGVCASGHQHWTVVWPGKSILVATKVNFN
jgi:hypothetical protein